MCSLISMPQMVPAGTDTGARGCGLLVARQRIGVPDDRAGERVCAFVVATGPVTLGDLVAHCASAGLSRYKHPERLVVVDALPRNPTGKVLKKELRERVT